MTILCSDTTSFGLLVACIPQLPAGKIPPRDPKIHGRRLGLGRPAAGERGERKGQGQHCKPGQASQRHSQTDNTAGMLTSDKLFQCVCPHEKSQFPSSDPQTSTG